MGECNNFTSVCPSIHSGVPTLSRGTYPGFVGDLPWESPYPGLGYLHWLGVPILTWVPTFVGGTYPGKRRGTYLGWGIPTLAWRYLPLPGSVPTLARE